jgi:Chaperone of endosialidase
MGLFDSGTSTTSSTTTPIMTAEQIANYNSAMAADTAMREAAAGLPPSQVAGLDPMELQALTDTGTAVSAANATSQANAGLIDPSSQYEMQKVAAPSSTLDPVYQAQDVSYDDLFAASSNPYTEDVVDTTLAAMERQMQQDQLVRDAQASAVGGLTNTRAAVGDAVAQNLGNMSMAQMEAQLRSEGYDAASAQALARQQADRADELAKQGLSLEEAQAQAAQELAAANFNLSQEAQLGDYSNTMFDNSVSAATTLEGLSQNEYLRSLGLAGVEGALGETQRGLTQAEMDVAKNDLTWQAGINSSSNPGAMPTGQTTTGTEETPSMFNQLIGAASAGVGAYMQSDRRAKEDITDVDSALDKIARLSAHEYRYKPGFGHTRDRTSGLMAQELETSGIVGAVRDIGGVKHVDPYPVLATVVQAVNELREQMVAGRGL